MSKLRSLSTAFWSDPFVEDLSPSEKLLFIYLITNDKTNMLGIYESSIKKMSFETGINKPEIEKALKGFETVGKVKYLNNYVILVNYLKHQNFNTNMKKSAIDVYNSLPNELKDKDLNISKSNPLEGFESLCKHLGMVRKVEVEVEVEVEYEVEVEDKNTGITFSLFWDKYHSITNKPKTDRNPALKKWDKLNTKEQQLAIEKIEAYSKTNESKYLKKARTYLEDKTFNDEMKESKDEFLQGLRKLYNEANKHDQNLLHSSIVPVLMNTKHIKNTKFDVTYKQLYEVCSYIWNNSNSPKALESMFKQYDKEEYTTFKNVLFDIKKYMTN